MKVTKLSDGRMKDEEAAVSEQAGWQLERTPRLTDFRRGEQRAPAPVSKTPYSLNAQ